MKPEERKWFEEHGVAALWQPAIFRSKLAVGAGFVAWKSELETPERFIPGPARVSERSWILRTGEVVLSIRYEALRDRAGAAADLEARIRVVLPQGRRACSLLIEWLRPSASELTEDDLSTRIRALTEGVVSQAAASLAWGEVPRAGDLGLDESLFEVGLKLGGHPAWRVSYSRERSESTQRRIYPESRFLSSPVTGRVVSRSPTAEEDSSPDRTPDRAPYRRAGHESDSRRESCSRQPTSSRSMGFDSVGHDSPRGTTAVCTTDHGELFSGSLAIAGSSVPCWTPLPVPAGVGRASVVDVGRKRLTIGGTEGIVICDEFGRPQSRYRIPIVSRESQGAARLAPSSMAWVGGQLWAAGTRCGVWSWPHPVHSHRQLGPEPMPLSGEIRLVANPRGDVWLGRGAYVIRLRVGSTSATKNRAEVNSRLSMEPLPSVVTELWVDNDALWVGTRSGSLYMAKLNPDAPTSDWVEVDRFADRIQGLVSWKGQTVAGSAGGLRVYSSGSPRINARSALFTTDAPSERTLPERALPIRESTELGNSSLGISVLRVDSEDRLWAVSHDGRTLLRWSSPSTVSPDCWSLPFRARDLSLSPARRWT